MGKNKGKKVTLGIYIDRGRVRKNISFGFEGIPKSRTQETEFLHRPVCHIQNFDSCLISRMTFDYVQFTLMPAEEFI
jgi:hypothetical protein